MPGMKRVARTAALALTLTSLAAPEAHAQQQRRTRPEAAIGASAAEYRLALSQRDRMAQQYGVSQRLIEAIAASVGTELGRSGSRVSDAQLLQSVERIVRRAQELRAENRRLREEVGRLRDPALRDPALALLSQAEGALEEGRLADAERLYGRIAELRWAETAGTLDALVAVVTAQATAIELQGTDDAYERADVIRERGGQRAEQLAEVARFTFTLARLQGRLQQGELLGRRRALEEVLRIFQEDLASSIASDPLAERWLPAQLAHVRAVRLLAQTEGGEQAKFRLLREIGRLAQATMTPEQPIASEVRLPRPLRIAFLGLGFDLLEQVDAQEAGMMMQAGFAVILGRGVQSLSPGAPLNFQDGVTDEEFELHSFLLRSLAPFVRRQDIIEYVARTEGENTAALMRGLAQPAAFAGATMALVLNGQSGPIPVMANPEQYPAVWAENALLAADVLAFEAETGTSAEFFAAQGIRDRNILTNIGIRLAVRARELSAQPVERQNIPLMVRSDLQLGDLMRIDARLRIGAAQAEALRLSRANYLAVRERVTEADQPLAWADSAFGLARLHLLQGDLDPVNVCVHAAHAHEQLSIGLRLVAGRRPEYSWRALSDQRDQLGAGQCSAAIAAMRSAVAAPASQE